MVQGILVSILALFFAVIPDVNSAFWVLTAIAVQLDMIMYMILFMTALKLRRTQPEVPRGFRAPAMRLVGWVGFFASLLAFVIGFFHPPGSSMNNVVHVSLLLLGIVILGGGPLLFSRFRRSSWGTSNDGLRS
jgi:amino acid transporter